MIIENLHLVNPIFWVEAFRKTFSKPPCPGPGHCHQVIIKFLVQLCDRIRDFTRLEGKLYLVCCEIQAPEDHALNQCEDEGPCFPISPHTHHHGGDEPVSPH